MSTTTGISLIVPTRNEESIIENNLKLIDNYLAGLFELYEIVVADYSEDSTPELVNNLSKKYPIRYIHAGEKGIGVGLRIGLEAAKYNLLMVYPIDMSWNMECIQTSFQKLLSNNGDIILGSRGYKGSVVNRTLKRIVFSKIYNMLVNLFFNLNVKDTQCTAAFRKADIIPFISFLDSKTAFFQTQLLIYSKKSNLKIVEIPVIVNDIRKDSKINPVGYGFSMLKDLINEFYKSKNFDKYDRKI